ncbi:MAG TPA: inositol monophosphatase family protein, partial [Alphaproteobacteria bacterium]|nr:inositol monophosphatase family protein [Alphaproteobacteria bacterium]
AMMESFIHPSRIVSRTKADGSPVTNVDEAASTLIETRLKALTPGRAVVTEENVATLPAETKNGDGLSWVVDPLDGTSEFLRGAMGFAINIALFENREPVLGVVYQPALALGFCAVASKNPRPSAFRFDTCAGRIMSVAPLHTTSTPVDSTLATVFRKAKANEVAYRDLRDRLASRDVHLPAIPDTPTGLIREMRVAMGRADLCVKLGSTPGPGGGGYPWDIGAMIPIVQQAGGTLCTWTGDRLVVGALDERVPSFLAFASPNVALRALPALRGVSLPATASDKPLANRPSGALECLRTLRHG